MKNSLTPFAINAFAYNLIVSLSTAPKFDRRFVSHLAARVKLASELQRRDSMTESGRQRFVQDKKHGAGGRDSVSKKMKRIEAIKCSVIGCCRLMCSKFLVASPRTTAHFMGVGSALPN